VALGERLVASVTDIRDRGQRLARLNAELFKSELKQKGGKAGAAAGLFAAAGVVAVYAVGFALATVAVALALVLPLWAALLIVTAALILLAVILGLVGRSLARQMEKPAPQEAQAEAKKTADLLKSHLREAKSGMRAKLAALRPAPGTGPNAPSSAAWTETAPEVWDTMPSDAASTLSPEASRPPQGGTT